MSLPVKRGDDQAVEASCHDETNQRADCAGGPTEPQVVHGQRDKGNDENMDEINWVGKLAERPIKFLVSKHKEENRHGQSPKRIHEYHAPLV